MSALLQGFAEHFDALPPALREAHGLGAGRREALRHSLETGLPGSRNEAWKYTSLRAFDRRRYAPSLGSQALPDALLASLPRPRIVFVNGRFDAAASDWRDLPPGIEVQLLSQLLVGADARATSFLARRFDRADEVFGRLNAALATEGLVLRVTRSESAVAVLHCICIGMAAEGGAQSWHLRHLIELGDHARMNLVEHYLGVGEHAHFGNSLSHVHLRAGARLQHLRIQNEAPDAALVQRVDAVLARAANYQRFDLELGSVLSRHELNVQLQGESATVQADGVLLGNDARHLDTHLGIDHVTAKTRSSLDWRGLAQDRSRIAFHGGIQIRTGADGSEAALTNKNLLLSAQAEVDTRPVLEIHADEVKAAHGATVGKLDANALFYLRSRGIPLAQAQALLHSAFLTAVLERIEDASLRALAGKALRARVGGGDDAS